MQAVAAGAAAEKVRFEERTCDGAWCARGRQGSGHRGRDVRWGKVPTTSDVADAAGESEQRKDEAREVRVIVCARSCETSQL